MAQTIVTGADCQHCGESYTTHDVTAEGQSAFMDKLRGHMSSAHPDLDKVEWYLFTHRGLYSAR